MAMTNAKRESWKNQMLAVAGLSAGLVVSHLFLPNAIFIIVAVLGVPATIYNIVREASTK